MSYARHLRDGTYSTECVRRLNDLRAYVDDVQSIYIFDSEELATANCASEFFSENYETLVRKYDALKRRLRILEGKYGRRYY